VETVWYRAQRYPVLGVYWSWFVILIMDGYGRVMCGLIWSGP
jgi:hypothetical protein